MTLYAADEDGACVCIDCIHGGCVRSSMPCEAEHCQCDCNRDENGALLCDGDPAGNPYPHTCAADGVMNCTACAYQPHVRARELDDRPDDKLHVIAAEIELEAKPSVEELMVERYGPAPRRAA